MSENRDGCNLVLSVSSLREASREKVGEFPLASSSAFESLREVIKYELRSVPLKTAFDSEFSGAIRAEESEFYSDGDFLGIESSC